MKHCVAWVACQLWLLPTLLDADCRVTSPSRKAFGCATYAYFGPQDRIVQGTALQLDGQSLCQPRRSIVEGQIVVVGPSWPDACDSYLGLGELYDRLDGAGAAAVVVVDVATMFQHGSVVRIPKILPV